MNYSLTERESQLFNFIRLRIDATGIAPSFDEMRDHMGLASKSTIWWMINALERRGVLHRQERSARSIKLTHWTCPHCGGQIASKA